MPLSDVYEKEFVTCTQAATANMEKMRKMPPGSEKEKLGAETTKALDAASEVVEQMTLQAGSSSGEARTQLSAQTREYKAAITKLRGELRAVTKSHFSQDAARAELLTSSTKAHSAEAETQNARLLQTTERMQRSTDTLRNACKTAIETEAVGASIMGDLEMQRATLESARSRLSSANLGLAKSKKLLKGMSKRAVANKVLMIAIIAALIGMIVLIIWLQFFYSPSPPSSPSPSPPLPPPPLPPL